MIAPVAAPGKSFLRLKKQPKNPAKWTLFDHEVVNGTIITPNFGQARVTLGGDNVSVASKARSGMSTGFLSPPAPRGSTDRAD